MLLVGPLPSRV